LKHGGVKDVRNGGRRCGKIHFEGDRSKTNKDGDPTTKIQELRIYGNPANRKKSLLSSTEASYFIIWAVSGIASTRDVRGT